jgi:hypothetical protein
MSRYILQFRCKKSFFLFLYAKTLNLTFKAS